MATRITKSELFKAVEALNQKMGTKFELDYCKISSGYELSNSHGLRHMDGRVKASEMCERIAGIALGYTLAQKQVHDGVFKTL